MMRWEEIVSQFRYLFSSGKIGSVEIKNRIIFSPMLDRLAHEDGRISEASIRYYDERALGGAGLLIVGAACFMEDAHYHPHQTSICDDSLIESHQRLTETIHRSGTRISCQLLHPGIRLAQKAFGAGRATRPVGPSALPFVTTDTIPHALTIEEILEITEAYAAAARRVKAARYDMVDLLAGHGYLLHSFLSPYFNKREDGYGGSIENRARFVCEVVRRIKEEAGEQFPIHVRMNDADFLPGGLQIDEAMVHARLLERAGADAINVTAGTRETNQYSVSGVFFPQSLSSEMAEKVKSVVKIPVTSVGRYTDPLRAEEVLAEGKADFILMARALLADPELPNKAMRGRLSEIRRCIGDNAGCIARDIRKFPTISCTVNATVGHEEEYRIRPATVARKVMVVGGGPAGMEAARVAAMRGHRVVLYEEADTLGGQLLFACRTPHHQEVQHLTQFLVGQLQTLGVEVHTGVTVTCGLVSRIDPDAVVVAAGAKPIRPDVPGAESENVVLAADVLSGRAMVGDRVVVVGGGLVGMETGLALAQEGKRVILIEMLPKIGMNANRIELLCLMERFIERGVQVLTNTRLLHIHPNAVTVILTSLTNENEVITLSTDTVVVAVGYQASEDLARELGGTGRLVYIIGDCREPRKIIDAIHEGYRTGLIL
jgi:2,4-dienoyl-CoA reductase-like NADH-dependent reductase (Old Yellow Enzyme family)/thioredoxin reductase